MGIVTSNAWLDVNFGYALQKFFCDNFKIIAILESRCEPWFPEAGVNTVLTIVERCDNAKHRDDHIVKFVKVKKRLTELAPGDPKIEAKARWRKLEQHIEQIEKAGKPYSKTVPLGVATVEYEDFRIRVCRQGEVKAELEREEKTVKWGKFIRAPEVLFDLVRAEKLCPLAKIAEVSRGSLSGNNEFYHLTPQQARESGIEPEFLQPLLKSPGESDFIPINEKQIELRVFVCRLSKEELKKQKKKGALAYIEWGEEQVFAGGPHQGHTWPNGAEVRVRKPGWYAIPEHRSQPAHVFLMKAFHDRHFQRYSQEPVIADQRLYFLTPLAKLSDELLAAVLNSSVTALCTEVFGRVSLGEGALELAVEDARDYLLVPDIRKITTAQKKSITDAFEKLCERPIGKVFEEVKQKDRQALDVAVLQAIGLDPKKYLQPIYDGLCELVRERIELGQMRGKARKVKSRKGGAEKQTLQEVLTEELPNGPHRFPDEFFSDTAKGEAKTDIELPDKELILDTGSLLPALYAKDKSWNRAVKSPAEGKFLLYAQQAGHKVAQLPAERVEVSRTVANYEKYLRELRQRLYEAFHRRTLDTRIAATLTQSVFDKFRLPKVET